MTKHVALTDEQVRILSLVADERNRSVDDVVREAVDDLIARRARSTKALEDAAFGAWGPGEDGLAYQERLRREW